MATTSRQLPDPVIDVQEVHVRLLLPFLLPAGVQAAVREVIREQTSEGATIWTIPELNDVHAMYSQELLPDIAQFLFSNGEGCVYARLRPELAQKWFRNAFVLDYQRSESSELPKSMRTSIVPGLNVELLVSPFGAGVLSLTVRSNAPGKLGLDEVLEFNYKLAQLIANKAPLVQLPAAPGQSSSIELGSPLEQRLGKTGAQFRFEEICDYLLQPLDRRFQYRRLQTQMSTYTVVHCGSGCDLSNQTVCDEIAPFLSGLAQSEESSHSGSVRGTITIANEMLNRCHWAAVSSLGSAHVVCDQPSPYVSGKELDFNAQRLQIVRDKYFVAYLVVLLQRLALANLVHEAERLAAHVDSDVQSKMKALHRLRQRTLKLSAQVAAYTISSREAVNRYYRLCERGLEFSRALASTTDTINSLEHCEQTDFQSAIAETTSRNIEALKQMQRTVGWLEVFFAAVYGLELFKALGEGLGFSIHYTNLSAVSWGLMCGILAAFVTRPWQHAKLGRRILITAGLLLAIGVWVWLRLAHR